MVATGNKHFGFSWDTGLNLFVKDSAMSMAWKPRLLASSKVRGCYTIFCMNLYKSSTYLSHFKNSLI